MTTKVKTVEELLDSVMPSSKNSGKHKHYFRKKTHDCRCGMQQELVIGAVTDSGIQLTQATKKPEIAHVEVWFDWSPKVFFWIVQRCDKDENQIGEAAYFTYKKEAVAEALRIREESDVDITIRVETAGQGASDPSRSKKFI